MLILDIDHGELKVACLLTEEERDWLRGKDVSGLKIRLGSRQLIVLYGEKVFLIDDAQVLREMRKYAAAGSAAQHCVLSVKKITEVDMDLDSIQVLTTRRPYADE